MLGDLISAAANVFGGFMNRESSKEANAINAAMAEKNIALQKEFAQSGVQWKVDDAKKAGVHPLYALGAQTTSFSPVSVGAVGDTSLGSGIASAGQDLSRAMAATASKPTRVEAVAQAQAIEKGALENDLLRVQIRKLNSQIGPPMPTLADKNPLPGQPVPIPVDKVEGAPVMMTGGHRWDHNPGWSNADDIEKRYGEMSDWTYGPLVAWADMVHNAQKTSKPWWGGDTLWNQMNKHWSYRHGASARGRDEAFRRSRAGRW